MSERADLDVLAELGSIPTASFHEEAVAAYVARFVRGLGLPLKADRSGNLVAEYRRGRSRLPVAFVAHLDHPAFEISAVESPTTARATLLGGVRAACFGRRVSVRIISGTGEIAGTIVGCAIDSATTRVTSLEVATSARVDVGDFGVFDLPGFERRGEFIAMRAADDLAGVAAALLALRRVARAGIDARVFGVFTRAEEVGLVGAEAIADQGILPKDAIVISLECSRSLPGAEPGLGPVIRVGDRTQSFHPDGEALLLAARRRLPGVKIQRQLMSGGTCEATAFVRAGYRATGVALPLLNYHNVGADDSIVPEEINVEDFCGEIDLLVAAAEASAEPLTGPADPIRAATILRYQERLAATSAPFRVMTQD